MEQNIHRCILCNMRTDGIIHLLAAGLALAACGCSASGQSRAMTADNGTSTPTTAGVGELMFFFDIRWKNLVWRRMASHANTCGMGSAMTLPPRGHIWTHNTCSAQVWYSKWIPEICSALFRTPLACSGRLTSTSLVSGWCTPFTAGSRRERERYWLPRSDYWPWYFLQEPMA